MTGWIACALFIGFSLILCSYGTLYRRKVLTRRTVGLYAAVVTFPVCSILQVESFVDDNQGRATVIFSTMDLELAKQTVKCLTGRFPKPLVPPCDRSYTRLEAVVSPAALETARRVLALDFADISTYPTEKKSIDYGLSLTNIVTFLRGRTGNKSDTYIVAPRSSDASADLHAIDELRREYTKSLFNIRFLLGDQLHYRGLNEVGIKISAPAWVSADAVQYPITIAFHNESSRPVQVSAESIVAREQKDRRHVIYFSDKSGGPISLTLAGTDGKSQRVARQSFDAFGSIPTPPSGKGSRVSAVAVNSFGESIAADAAYTLTQMPLIGVLTLPNMLDGEKSFLQFANAAGLHVRSIQIDLERISKMERSDPIFADESRKLSKWGVVIIDTPLSESQGRALEDILATPTGESAPGLLFVGAGNEKLHSDLNGPEIGGWRSFLAPIGIGSFSSVRRIAVAADMSASVEPFLPAERTAIDALFDPSSGLGTRESLNLIENLCRTDLSWQLCDKDMFKLQRNHNDSFWEAGDHLIAIDQLAQRESLFIDGERRYLLTDIILFEDAQDLCGPDWEPPCRGRREPYLSAHGSQALDRLLLQRVKPHIISFSQRNLPIDASASGAKVKQLEEISNFSSSSIKAFQERVVEGLIPRLEVKPDELESLVPSSREQLLSFANKKVRLANSLLLPDVRVAAHTAGAVIPLSIRHPSGFTAPLFVLRRSLELANSAVKTQTAHIPVGYLAVDIPTEFAPTRYRSASVADDSANLIVDVINAMGGKAHDPDIVWRVGDREVSVERASRKPFTLGPGAILGQVFVGATKASEVRWTGRSLLKPSLSMSDLTRGDGADLKVSLCDLSSIPEGTSISSCDGPTAMQSANSIWIPLRAEIPVLLSAAEIDTHEPGEELASPSARLGRTGLSLSRASYSALLVVCALSLLLIGMLA